MRVILYISVFVLLTGLQAPAHAIWNIPSDAVKKPTSIVEQPKTSWTAVPQQSMPVTSSAPAVPVSNLVVPSGSWVESAGPVVVHNDYLMSAQDVKFMNQQVLQLRYVGMYGTPVPEPGSIVGLSAGLLGLAFQVRRIRKRS